jgi:hypothetical protein
MQRCVIYENRTFCIILKCYWDYINCKNWLCETEYFFKLTVSQLVMKFPTFHGTQNFLTVCIRPRHWSLYAGPEQSRPFFPVPSTVTLFTESLCLLVLRRHFKGRTHVIRQVGAMESQHGTECQGFRFLFPSGTKRYFPSVQFPCDSMSHPASYPRIPCYQVGFKPFPRRIIP